MGGWAQRRLHGVGPISGELRKVVALASYDHGASLERLAHCPLELLLIVSEHRRSLGAGRRVNRTKDEHEHAKVKQR